MASLTTPALGGRREPGIGPLTGQFEALPVALHDASSGQRQHEHLVAARAEFLGLTGAQLQDAQAGVGPAGILRSEGELV